MARDEDVMEDVMRPTAVDSEALQAPDDGLPVVARLVVEIRSDGSRTVARGALEDRISGQQVAVRAEGTSPLALSLQLARALVSLPALAGRRLTGRPAPQDDRPRGRFGLRAAIRGALSHRRRDRDD